MILDLNAYRRVIKPLVSLHFSRHVDLVKEEQLGNLALITNCHIVAIGYFMAELYGMTPLLREKIDRHEKFYSPIEVINKEPFAGEEALCQKD